MVLHYDYFLENINTFFEEKEIDITNFQANFKERAKTKLGVYCKELKFRYGKLNARKKPFLMLESFTTSENVFP